MVEKGFACILACCHLPKKNVGVLVTYVWSLVGNDRGEPTLVTDEPVEFEK